MRTWKVTKPNGIKYTIEGTEWELNQEIKKCPEGTTFVEITKTFEEELAEMDKAGKIFSLDSEDGGEWSLYQEETEK